MEIENTSTLQEIIMNHVNQYWKMFWLAYKAHRGQTDSAGVSYINHPVAVSELLQTEDYQLKAIALGHDLLEDTDITEADLRIHGFSFRVVDGIVGLTKTEGATSKSYRKMVLATADRRAVKKADITHNMDLNRLPYITTGDLLRNASYESFLYDLENHHVG